MKTDYTCLAFALADLQLYQSVDTPYPPHLMECAVETILEYLIERDKPKRELILVENKLKEIKKELKAKVSLKARKALKKEVKKLGKLPAMKSKKTPKKRGK